MTESLTDKLVIAISSRALFDLTESNHIFETKGTAEYCKYQMEREKEPLLPGPAFSMVKKLLALKDPETQEPLTEVILLSHNNADTGLRIFNSIHHYQLPITRAVFTSGESTYRYVATFGAHLFLSANIEDVKNALESGCAAATMMTNSKSQNTSDELRIAFDGDSVIFSDDSERVYQHHGLDVFLKNESVRKDDLKEGPFCGFLRALHNIQQKFPPENCPIRTALITARSAPSHERVIQTLRSWNIRLDEAIFLGGLPKGDFLKTFNADLFFDDQPLHCASASQHAGTGHVPHGVINENNETKPFDSFRSFYPYYLSEHSNIHCRQMHFIGTLLVLLTIAFSFFTRQWLYLLLTPIFSYGFAWTGHYLFEKNKPASFSYTWYSFLGNWMMFKEILLGKIKIF